MQKPFVLVLVVKCQELGDADHRRDDLLGSQLGHLGLQHPDHHFRLPLRNHFNGKALWEQSKMVWEEKSPETTLAVGGVARIKPSAANSALPSALVMVMVEILSVPPPTQQRRKTLTSKDSLGI